MVLRTDMGTRLREGGGRGVRSSSLGERMSELEVGCCVAYRICAFFAVDESSARVLRLVFGRGRLSGLRTIGTLFIGFGVLYCTMVLI